MRGARSKVRLLLPGSKPWQLCYDAYGVEMGGADSAEEGDEGENAHGKIVEVL